MTMTRHGRAGLLAAPLLTLLLVSAPPLLTAQETLDGIAAVVNEDVILKSELEQQIQQVRQRMRSQNRRPPSDDELVDQVLEQLIMERLQLSRAEEMGIQVDDNTLNAAVRRIAQQNNMNLRQFRRAVQRQGMDFASFREDLRQDIRMRRLRQQAARSRVNISSRDVEEFLDSRAARMEGTEFRVSHILVDVPNAAEDNAVQQARERAEGIVERVQEDDESFARVASSVSDAEDALEGGDLGWRAAGEIPSMFQDQVLSLDPGEIAGPIRSSNGFHIVKLEDTRPAEETIVEQTRARHILIRTNQVVDDDEARLRLENLRERIQQGTSFEELARAHSDDPGSASEGGDLGWINPGEMSRGFEQAIDRLEPGTVSEPFQTRFGWHIAEVLERREHDSTDERRRAQAAQQLRQQRSQEAVQSWLEQLRDDAFVDIRIES